MMIGRAMASFVFVEFRLLNFPVSESLGVSVDVLWAVVVSDVDADVDVDANVDVDVDVVEEDVEVEVEVELKYVVIEE